ncbi:MAG: hypothetical protein U0517_03865 [Candidatus Andersenbacteria bacterium]
MEGSSALHLVTPTKRELRLKTPLQLKELAEKRENQLLVAEELFHRLAPYRRHIVMPYTAEANRDFKEITERYKVILQDNRAAKLLLQHPGLYAITSSVIAATDPVENLGNRVEHRMTTRGQQAARLTRETYNKEELKRHQARQTRQANNLARQLR